MRNLKIFLIGVWMVAGYGVCMAQEEEENRDYQYALIEAVKQKNLGNIPEALKLYRLVIKEKPDCDAAHYELGTILLMLNQVSPAIESLGQAYQLVPENRWYLFAYLDALKAGEQYELMEKILKDKIKSEPGEAEWEFQLATLYFSQQKPKKALKILEEIEQDRGFSEKVTLLKASIYENEEQYDQALTELEKVMVLFPEAVQFRIVAAELCLKSGRDDAAAEYYLDILQVDSTNIFALTNLTDYYRKKEDYEKSFRYLTKSFQNELIDARRKMAILSYYLSEDRFINQYSKELEHLLEVLIEVHPGAYDARLMASEFYIQTREFEKAYNQLAAYIKGNGGTYPVYMQAILLANAASLNDELIYITGEAIRNYPDSADVWFFRGIGYYELNDYEALIGIFDSLSFEKFSSDEYAIQAKMLYAEAFYRIEEYTKSDSIFESLIEEDPDNYVILNNYSYYLAEREVKLEKAENWSRKTIDNNPDNSTFLDTYAWILFKQKKYEKAEQYIMKAMEKGGENDPEINEHAGDIQVALSSYEIARSYYRKAMILGGDQDRLEKKINTITQE